MSIIFVIVSIFIINISLNFSMSLFDHYDVKKIMLFQCCAIIVHILD